MIPYLFLLASVGFPALLGIRRGALLFAGLGLLYFVMIGWRYHVGMDWNNYLAILQRDSNKDFVTLTSGAEAGFGALIWLSGRFGGVTFLNVFSAAVFTLGLFIVAKRCPEPLLALCVATPYLVIAVAMSATRQSIALGLVFFMFGRWPQLGTFSRSLYVLCASLFHFSAMVNAVFVVLASQLTGLKRVAAAAFVGLSVLIIIIYFPIDIGFYSESYVKGRYVIQSPGAVLHVLLLTVPAILYYSIRRQWGSVVTKNALMEQLAVASLVALPLLPLSSTGIDRLSLYLWPSAMYIWSGLPTFAKTSTGRIGLRVLIVAASVCLTVSWLIFANNSDAYMPYRNTLITI